MSTGQDYATHGNYKKFRLSWVEAHEHPISNPQLQIGQILYRLSLLLPFPIFLLAGQSMFAFVMVNEASRYFRYFAISVHPLFTPSMAPSYPTNYNSQISRWEMGIMQIILLLHY
jgi:hypothetical protein